MHHSTCRGVRHSWFNFNLPIHGPSPSRQRIDVNLVVYAAKGISSSILGRLLIYFGPTLASTIAVGTLLGTRPKEFYVWYDVYPPPKSISAFDSSVVLTPLVACGLLWRPVVLLEVLFWWWVIMMHRRLQLTCGKHAVSLSTCLLTWWKRETRKTTCLSQWNDSLPHDGNYHEHTRPLSKKKGWTGTFTPKTTWNACVRGNMDSIARGQLYVTVLKSYIS